GSGGVNGAMLLAALVWAGTIIISYFFAVKRWWFPPAISGHALDYDHHFALTLLVMGTVFMAAHMLLGLVIIRGSGNGPKRPNSDGSNRLELAWTSVTTIVFLGLGLASTRIWAEALLAPEPPNALRVEVMAKQFAWSYRYPGPDGKFGRTDIK